MLSKNVVNFFGNRVKWDNIQKFLPLVFVLICFFIALALQSRAFCFGYLLAIFTLFVFYNKGRFKITFYIKAAIVLILILISLSFLIKKDSSLGRLFIYKLSLRMLKDHFVFGIGSEKFGYEYLNYQHNYFKGDDYSTKELLLADNTKHAFNDYLQFAIEHGVNSLIIMVPLLYFIFYSSLIAIKRYHNDNLLLTSISQIIAIGTAALFTHVFEQVYFSAVTLICVLIILSSAWHRSISRINLIMLATSAVVFICLFPYYTNRQQNRELEEANGLFRSGYLTESRSAYVKLYPEFKDNVSFLDGYSNLLSASNRLMEQELILEHIVKIDNASIFHLKLANCYKANGKFVKAESEYLKAIHTVPAHLLPRYELFKFYLETDRFSNAVHVGRTLLEVPIKVQSDRTKMIRSNTKTLLQKLFIANQPLH